MSPSKRPLVTIGIPFKNVEFLPAALQSVLDQTMGDFELLLVDDRTAGPIDTVMPFLLDRRVSLLCDGRSLGLAARLNQITLLSRGKYLARMDADDIMAPARLERQIHLLESDNTINVVGTAVLIIDDQNTLLGSAFTKRIQLCRRFSYLRLFHPTVMGRNEWFRRNPYSTEFFRCEDYELWLRTAGNGDISYIAEPLLYYRVYPRTKRPEILKTLEERPKALKRHREKVCSVCRLRCSVTTKLQWLIYRFVGGTRLFEKISSLRLQAGRQGLGVEHELFLQDITQRAEQKVLADVALRGTQQFRPCVGSDQLWNK